MACYRGEVVAESDACLIVKESDHQDQLYFPTGDIVWPHFAASDLHTVCPFKGEASYWSLTVGSRTEANVAWAYPDPFPEVEGLAGHAAFYLDRVDVELIEDLPDGDAVHHRFPAWGTAAM